MSQMQRLLQRIAELLNPCDAVRIIEKRGFNRSRNLVEALKAAWEEFR